MSETRNFLHAALAAGLECRTITPEDVLRHLTPEVLAAHLPVPIKARLLSASLKAERLSPALLIECVEVKGLAEHLPEHLLWRCIAEAAERALGSAGSKGVAEASLSGRGRSAAVPTTLFRGTTSDKVVRTTASRRPNVSRRPTGLTGVGAVVSRSSVAEDLRTAGGAEGWRAPSGASADEAEGPGDALADWADEHTLTGDPGNQRKR